MNQRAPNRKTTKKRQKLHKKSKEKYLIQDNIQCHLCQKSASLDSNVNHVIKWVQSCLRQQGRTSRHHRAFIVPPGFTLPGRACLHHSGYQVKKPQLGIQMSCRPIPWSPLQVISLCAVNWNVKIPTHWQLNHVRKAPNQKTPSSRQALRRSISPKRLSCPLPQKSPRTSPASTVEKIKWSTRAFKSSFFQGTYFVYPEPLRVQRSPARRTRVGCGSTGEEYKQESCSLKDGKTVERTHGIQSSKLSQERNRSVPFLPKIANVLPTKEDFRQPRRKASGNL